MPYPVSLWNGLSFELRPGRGDLSAFHEWWLHRRYPGGGGRLQPGNIVIDVGANIGCFTLFAARRVGPKGRVVAVEPDPESFHRLERHVRMNRLSNVLTLRAAVSAQSGQVSLYSSYHSPFSSIFAEIDGRANTGLVQKVPAFDIEEVMARAAVDHCHYLKLNCEGAEHGIIGTMSAQTAAKIDQIAMELHKVTGTDQNALLQRLMEFGFRVQRRGALLYCHRT